MNALILCEGKTDAVLLSYLLKNERKWEPETKLDKIFRFQFEENHGEYAHSYKKDKNKLVIAAVGGKNNFGSFYTKKIKEIQLNGELKNIFQKIVVVIDSDEEATTDIITKTNKAIGFNFLNNVWNKQSFKNYFDQDVALEVLIIIVPLNSAGALESVLIEAVKELNHSELVRKAREFISCVPKDPPYIKNKRESLKAQLGCIFSVLSPEKVFTYIDKIISGVKWGKSETVMNTFKEILDI